MAQRTIVVCDVCEDPKRDTKQYTVQEGGRKVTKDLCTLHSRPLEVMLGGAKPTGRPAKKVAASRGSSNVTSMEDIEKLKK